MTSSQIKSCVRELRLKDFQRYFELLQADDEQAILAFCVQPPSSTDPATWIGNLTVDETEALLDEVERVNFPGLARWITWKPARLQRLLESVARTIPKLPATQQPHSTNTGSGPAAP